MRRRLSIAALLCACSVAAMLPASADPGPSWVRISFDERIRPSDRAALIEAGVSSLQYAPRDAYVGFASSEAMTRASRVRGVSAVRPVRPSEKVDPSVRSRRGTGPTTVLGAASTEGWSDIASMLGMVRTSYATPIAPGVRAIEGDLPAAAISALAGRPDVLYVGPAMTGALPEDEGATQILANNIPGNQPVPGYESFLASRGLDGSGVTITIADDGIDPTHPEFLGRIAKRISYGPVGAYPAEGHGTHVAGIAGGQGVDLPGIGRIRDSAGLLYGIGVAPKMTFVDQNVIELVNSQVNPPRNGNNLATWIRDGVRAGSYGWNASWHSGEGTGAGYIANAALLDGLTRDGDAETPGAQPFALVFSAGNAGGSPRTITSPKEAKNMITVGNSLGHRAGNIDSINSGSSRGPAADGRILPTVAAPGSSIVSARAAMGALCATSPPTDSYGLYSSCTGTSMAAPQVTGSVALIVQWWRKEHGRDPSTAMAKALLINSAKDIGNSDVPNGNEGWGRVNLAALFDASTPRILMDQSVVFTSRDQAHAVEVTAADPTKPLKVSVVWSDAPGMAGVSPALVNDLDLRVTGPDGVVYLGNRFSQGRSVTGGSPDRKNNLENVFLRTPGEGTFRIDISAFNVPGDGIPENATNPDQDFALVISNAVAV